MPKLRKRLQHLTIGYEVSRTNKMQLRKKRKIQNGQQRIERRPNDGAGRSPRTTRRRRTTKKNERPAHKRPRLTTNGKTHQPRRTSPSSRTSQRSTNIPKNRRTKHQI